MQQSKEQLPQQNTTQPLPKIQQEQLRVNKQNVSNIVEQNERKGSSESQTSQDESSTQNNELEEIIDYQLIGMKGNVTNQTLFVKILPQSVLWYKGNIIFSSIDVKQRDDTQDIVKNLMQALNLYDSPPRQLINQGAQLNYYILSKQEPLNGKILVLDQKVYQERFYINYKHLLAVNYHNHEYTLRSHPNFKYMRFIQINKLPQPLSLFIVLQSTKDTSIVEKYLAAQQHLYLPNANLLAMSETISCTWERKLRFYKFTGPGWVFFEPNSINLLLPVRNRDFIVANLLLILLIVGLYIIEYLYLK